MYVRCIPVQQCHTVADALVACSHSQALQQNTHTDSNSTAQSLLLVIFIISTQFSTKTELSELEELSLRHTYHHLPSAPTAVYPTSLYGFTTHGHQLKKEQVWWQM